MRRAWIFDMADFREFTTRIEDAKNILVFTHAGMDGDAVGSAKALCLVLRKLGKSCEIIIEDDMPHYLDFMDTSCFVSLDEYSARACAPPDIAIAVDFGTPERLEKREDLFRKAGLRFCIDHHEYSEGELAMAELNIRDTSAAASAVLVQELIEEIERIKGFELIDREIAEALYVGTLTDTGSFRYANTDTRAHLCVSRLFAFGIDSSFICTEIYDSYPMPQLKLEALALSRIRIFAGGRACISWCTLKDMEELGAVQSMAESCIDRLRSLKGVEIAAFVRQKPDGVYKASLRSKYEADVDGICVSFGGGGHAKAAGCSFRCGLKEAMEQLTARIEEELDNVRNN